MKTEGKADTRAMAVVEEGAGGAWTPAQIELIKSMCVPQSATSDEFTVMLYMAEKYGLDPLAKQIYMQKFKDKNSTTGFAPATIMVTYAGMQEIANRSDMLDGIKASPFFDEKGNLVGARSVLWKKGHQHPFEIEVYIREYIQYNWKNEPMGLWGTKPVTMICKVANAQNLRQAFSLGQMYTEEEIPQLEEPAPSRQERPELKGTQYDTMKMTTVETIPMGHIEVEVPAVVAPEPEIDASVAERIDRARKIHELTGISTVYDNRGTWTEISEQQTANALHKLVGAASIQQAAAMIGVGKFGPVVTANFPDAMQPRMRGGPAQQYSALLHYVHDYVERQEQHRAEQTKAKTKMAEEVFGAATYE